MHLNRLTDHPGINPRYQTFYRLHYNDTSNKLKSVRSVWRVSNFPKTVMKHLQRKNFYVRLGRQRPDSVCLHMLLAYSVVFSLRKRFHLVVTWGYDFSVLAKIQAHRGNRRSPLSSSYSLLSSSIFFSNVLLFSVCEFPRRNTRLFPSSPDV